ncbi:MAG: hypothetical protein KGI28_04425 [Thaumarchaeota archaeon]|nr:hypothetical protein [Nitrososphaerota archaeon]
MTGYSDSMYEFDSLCANIAKINDSIELVAILNNKGRVIEISEREDGINKELMPQKREMFFMESVLKSSMNKEHDNEFGKVHGTIIEREKFTIFSFDVLNYVIVVISRPLLNPISVKNNIVNDIMNLRRIELVQ